MLERPVVSIQLFPRFCGQKLDHKIGRDKKEILSNFRSPPNFIQNHISSHATATQNISKNCFKLDGNSKAGIILKGTD